MNDLTGGSLFAGGL